MKSTPRFDAASRLLPELVVALAITFLLFSLANLGGSAKASHDPRLVISEVHPSVLPTDSSTDSNEWVEIHNLERHPVSLEGWTIEDSQAIARLPDFEIEPGGAVLVVGSSADIAVPAGRSLVILESANIGTGLRDAGDRVALVNPLGVRHDAVSWGSVRTPRAIDPPNPRQSIIRTPTGGQTLSDETPSAEWEAIRAERTLAIRADTAWISQGTGGSAGWTNGSITSSISQTTPDGNWPSRGNFLATFTVRLFPRISKSPSGWQHRRLVSTDASGAGDQHATGWRPLAGATTTHSTDNLRPLQVSRCASVPWHAFILESPGSRPLILEIV